MAIKEVRMPKYPECWDTCGNCASGNIFVLDVLVSAGESINADDNLITLETGKVALDIPSPYAGRVIELHVAVGDELDEGALLATIETE